MRKTVGKIHELDVACRVFEVSKDNDVAIEMEERLRVLNRQHCDIINRLTSNEDVLRRRLELWNAFKRDQQILKSWTKEIENEKSFLNLKHLQLDTINNTMSVIQVGT